jgi:hypothetical protein
VGDSWLPAWLSHAIASSFSLSTMAHRPMASSPSSPSAPQRPRVSLTTRASLVSSPCSAASSADLPVFHIARDDSESRMRIGPSHTPQACQPCLVTNRQLGAQMLPFVAELAKGSPQPAPPPQVGDLSSVESIPTSACLEM